MADGPVHGYAPVEVPMRTRSLSLLFLLVACAAGDNDDADFGAAEELGDTDMAEDDADPDRDDAPVGPAWWRIDGTLDIVDGAVATDGSSLQVRFLGESGSAWVLNGEPTAACSLRVVESVPGPPELAEAEGLFGWWQLAVETAEDAPCPWTIPTPDAVGDSELSQLILGLGPADPRLGAAMDAAGVPEAADVYGLYALHPGPEGDVVYVHGIAGTQANLDGAEPVVEDAPVPDGVYEIQTLVLLPIPEAHWR